MPSRSWLPTKADLDRATERTASVIADPHASPADVQRAAQLEASIHRGFLRRSGADAQLQREAEAEFEAAAG
jgi:hypothetical protein